ncbi:hypothetical protein H4R19_006200 [Coemansia spiralis]|nr:hypothetical protein H4R19_006200 [Coemansia spiralis]
MLALVGIRRMHVKAIVAAGLYSIDWPYDVVARLCQVAEEAKAAADPNSANQAMADTAAEWAGANVRTDADNSQVITLQDQVVALQAQVVDLQAQLAATNTAITNEASAPPDDTITGLLAARNTQQYELAKAKETRIMKYSETRIAHRAAQSPVDHAALDRAKLRYSAAAERLRALEAAHAEEEQVSSAALERIEVQDAAVGTSGA